MSKKSRNILNRPFLSFTTAIILTNLARNQSPGEYLLSPYTLVSLGLDFTQMVLDVQKHLKPTQFYMLNNLCFNNFSKKSIPGDVRAQVLQEPVGASHADQGRKSCVHRTFLDPGGQARSNGTPHLGFGSSPCIPQGGSLLYYIYRLSPSNNGPWQPSTQLQGGGVSHCNMCNP